MVKKKSLDYVAAANARRIVIYAPSAELKQEFERIAAEQEPRCTVSNLGWHLFLKFMREHKAAKAKVEAA